MQDSLPQDAKFAAVKLENLPELQAMADAYALLRVDAPLTPVKKAKLEQAAKPTASAVGPVANGRKGRETAKEPRGNATWNLGAYGNYGFRAIAAACAAQAGKTQAKIKANVEKLTKSLKAPANAWLKQNPEWELLTPLLMRPRKTALCLKLLVSTLQNLNVRISG